MNHRSFILTICLISAALISATMNAEEAVQTENTPELRKMLDAPMLFAKRPSYQGIHIYDTYYQWHPGGGLYVLENPWEEPAQHRIRAIIDPNTPETLGEGVYSDPELSWDATKILFCFKGAPKGSTAVYEIGIDGTGLRMLSKPGECQTSCGRYAEQHDIAPAYLPDGRIVLTSTRPNGLVPCNNTGVNILHVMDPDGSNFQRLSVNNVNEFDPAVMPDGRILHGRWEYVDKTALTQQSLWSIFPDGTNETAVFANNLVVPEALLDARPVPGKQHLIATTLAKHNATPRGSIAIINTRVSKNDPSAIYNFDYPDNPTVDTGDSCEPWPLSENVMLFSGRPAGAPRNIIEMVDRQGHRQTILEDPAICLHSPMLIKPRTAPSTIPKLVEPEQKTGYFFVQDIYKGLNGVERGEVKWLRVMEETSRTSASPGPGGPFNQQFLVSAALAFSVKNFLGIVPVEKDGSAYFEVPAGRALFLQALDADGRMVHSMRTFVQAAPGATRSCIGCHERKFDAPKNEGIQIAHRLDPVKPQPESWGSGYLDYSSMVQPVFDKHCVECHGGEKGFKGKLDLTGGWTEFFNISYENLVSRRDNQMIATLIAGIDCMNGTAKFSAQRFGPRSHGSGAAPLGELLVKGHKGRIPNLSREERDLIMAWIDTNGLYYGSWDYTEHKPGLVAWNQTRDALLSEMGDAGCMECHASGNAVQFESDWFNLKAPEKSRILRAPLAKSANGLEMCQAKKTEPRYRRVRLLVNGYAHAVQPLEKYVEQGKQPLPDPTPAEPVATFASTKDEHYLAMLDIIKQGRRDALSTPRVDMPGAIVIGGTDRQFNPPALPNPLPALNATVNEEGIVTLAWERSARTIGLKAEVHRSIRDGFTPDQFTRLTETRGFQFQDLKAPIGAQQYALILKSNDQASQPIRVSIDVPEPAAPAPPAAMEAEARMNIVRLQWEETTQQPQRYHVYRAVEDASTFEKITEQPINNLTFSDMNIQPETRYEYMVRTVSIRDKESPAITPVSITTPEFVLDPIFAATFEEKVNGLFYGGKKARGSLHGEAEIQHGALDLRRGGHATYEYAEEFNTSNGFSIELQVKVGTKERMPVLLSCGQWNGPGWFLQVIGGRLRWYVGGVVCDGGSMPVNQWVRITATFDGQTAKLYLNHQPVAQASGTANLQPFGGLLYVGQYSASPGAAYQTNGFIKDVHIYHRALHEKEITPNTGANKAV